MINNQNPDELLFFIVRFKEDLKEQKLNVLLSDKKELNIESKDLEKERNENFITRIIYFKKEKGKNSYLLTFGTKIFTLLYNNDLQFLYDDNIKSSTIIEMSIFEKFKGYKKFVENSGVPNLINTFYNDSFKLCLKPSIHFLIFLNVLEHFKEQPEKTNKLFKNISLVSKFNNFKIEEMKETDNKYIELIESLTQNQNVNLKSKYEEKGKLMVIIFLYVSLSYEDKFITFYNKYKKDKKEIYNIINQIQIIEHLFIEKKLGKKIEETNNEEEFNELLKWCKYFSNFIYLLSFYIKNTNKLSLKQEVLSKTYEVSNEDNLPLILERYKEIKNIIPSFSVNKTIWDNYHRINQAKKNLDNLLLLKDLIHNKDDLNETINEVIKDTFNENKPSNLILLKYIQEKLLPNLDWFKGKLMLSLGNYLNLKDLTDEVITEYKKCKFNELFGEENYLV